MPLYKQLCHSVIHDIEKGKIGKDFQLPSINEASRQYSISRDTIERCYKELKRQEYIASVAGRGYFITGKKGARLKVLLVFNKLSPFKRIIYDSFLTTLGKNVKVDLQIHHYNPTILKEIIEDSLGKYHHYVIIPHFFHKTGEARVLKVLKKIPADQLLLLDKNLPKLGVRHASVFQDFKQDIYDALVCATDLLAKYHHIKIVCDRVRNRPVERIEGTTQFCVDNKKKFDVVLDVNREELQPGTAYIVTDEGDLADLIKKIRRSEYELGKDIGIICFDDTPLKETLNITVATTDFEAMGKTSASLLLSGENNQVKNCFQLIRRGSL